MAWLELTQTVRRSHFSSLIIYKASSEVSTHSPVSFPAPHPPAHRETFQSLALLSTTFNSLVSCEVSQPASQPTKRSVQCDHQLPTLYWGNKNVQIMQQNIWQVWQLPGQQLWEAYAELSELTANWCHLASSKDNQHSWTWEFYQMSYCSSV